MPTNNNYIGGAFTFVRSTGSANITQIIINEEGTVNANSNLSNLDIYYETAGTCTYDGNETLFGTATSFNASDQATITGTMAVGTSQVCVYLVLDVGSAYGGSSVELEISNPSTDVTVSSGIVDGSSAVQISGTSTIVKVISVTIEDGSVEYGILDSGNTKDTISTQTQTVTNNGNIAEDFDIKGYDATGGGCTWSLVSGTPSTDQYKHEFSIDSGSHWSYLETSYKSLTTGISNGNNFDLDLKITMPSSSSCYNQQGTNVFVLATEAELESYTKRKSITINSSAALTDYQVKIDVTYDSDMQADFDDIRFTDSGGSTQLSYWLESKTDSSTATFWVKVPSLSSGDNTIYMYYGNGSAISDSNGDNTFVFFDHFEGSSLNGSKWTSSGTVSVSSSIVTVNNTLNSTWEGIGTVNSFTKNYATRARLKSSNWGNTGMWTGFDFATGSNEVNCRYSAPSGNGGGTYINYDGTAGSTNILGWSASVYHIQDIKLGNSAANFSVNNSNDVTLSSHYPSSGNMTLWVRVRKTSGVGETMYCDWVFVRKYSDTEPSISSWGSEENL